MNPYTYTPRDVHNFRVASIEICRMNSFEHARLVLRNESDETIPGVVLEVEQYLRSGLFMRTYMTTRSEHRQKILPGGEAVFFFDVDQGPAPRNRPIIGVEFKKIYPFEMNPEYDLKLLPEGIVMRKGLLQRQWEVKYPIRPEDTPYSELVRRGFHSDRYRLI